MGTFDRAYQAQISVIGSMFIDSRCIPLVLSKLSPEDFIDGTCRSTFTAIRKLAMEGRPVDSVTVVDAMQGGDRYIGWVREAMEVTPTAANVGEYIPIVRKTAVRRRILELSEKLPEADDEGMEALVRQMYSSLSAADRMPMMTAAERMADFHSRMQSQEAPKYLPWGIPVADRCVYAELGDMILLGGYASSGKTLLSITMATAQAKAGYRVGYYSLETSPQKMSDRQVASLSKVPLWKIKRKQFSEEEWAQFVQAESFAAAEAPFDVIDASGRTVDDIAGHAIGYRYQVIYVDYVQNLLAPGIRESDGYAKVTAISRALKSFSRSTGTAVVALAQLSRPGKDESHTPTMHSFKESGQLEQDADAAFLVYPADKKNTGSNRMFCIAKNKEGRRPAPVELEFHGDTQTMVERAPSVAAELSARGRAVKQKNRAAAQRAQFQELEDGDEDLPF